MTKKRFFIALALILPLYFIGILTHGWASDWQPGPAPTQLPFDQDAAHVRLEDTVFYLVTWNVGYGGLGAESDIFFDDEGMWHSGSSMTRTPEDLVKKNLHGAFAYLHEGLDSIDFYLLQEVDVASDRSYQFDQYLHFKRALPAYNATIAYNFRCPRVPIPLLEPWNAYGEVLSGISMHSRYEPKEATRHQLPGHYPMPDRMFQLDRCAALYRYPLEKRTGELVVINLHNSAYDPGDKIKAIQLPYLRDLALAEYAKGNYVILGGDWNQCPPNFRFDTFMPGKTQGYDQGNIPLDFFPEGWTYAYDPTVPSNRKARDPYRKGETFETLIDFFLVSPNVQVSAVKGVDQGFQFSDHQPVWLKVTLN